MAGVPRDDVVAVIRLSGPGKLGKRSVGRFSALNLHAAALRDHAGLPDPARRIGTVADFLVHVGQVKTAVSAALHARANAVLRKALNYAIGNSQGIARLPVNSVASALQGDIQVLQPAYAGESAEGSRGVNHRIADRCVAAYAYVAQAGIQTIQQEGFVVVHLHVAAKASTLQRDPGGNVEQPGLLRVHFNGGF